MHHPKRQAGVGLGTATGKDAVTASRCRAGGVPLLRHRIAVALLTLPMAACDLTDPEPARTPETRWGEEKKDIDAALLALPQAQVQGRHEDGVPFLITGTLSGTARSVSKGQGRVDASRVAGLALPSLAPAFRLQVSDLVVDRVDEDERGNTHIRYAQHLNGLPVVSQELIVHVNARGEVFMVNGNARGGAAPAATARISAAAAAESARLGAQGHGLTTKGEPRLVYRRANGDGALQLVYEVRVLGEGDGVPVDERVFVNALDGAVTERLSAIHTARNRAVYSANNGTSLPGTLMRDELAPAVADPVVNTNHDHLGSLYDCYKNLFNRDSYDNKGAPLKSTVHYKTRLVDAHWRDDLTGTGGQLVFGDGDGVTASNLANSLDVAGHELTHAVIGRSSKLEYRGESGGLNESMSDIFGSVCEWYADGRVVTAMRTFYLGDDVWTPAKPNDALRYMDDPTKDGKSLDSYQDFTATTDVHYSSGVSNLAFYLLSQGGTHPRGKTSTIVPGIGIEMAARIFYTANTSLFDATTTFARAKAYTVQAAVQLGYSAAVQDSVAKAWEAVGVGGTPPPIAKTPLVNGTAVTGLSGPAGSVTYFYLDVPANKPVTFALSDGTGDADLYVKFGGQPTTESFDCRPYVGGNSEQCILPAKTSAGRYEVMLHGYTEYAGTSLRGTY